MKVFKEENLYKIYPFFGMVLGLVFMLIIPIRMVPDETLHVAQAYEVSNRILGTSSGNNNIMMRQDDTEKYLSVEPYTKEQYRAYWASLNDPLVNAQMVDSGSQIYDHLYPYYLSGLGITVGRMMRLGTGFVFTAGRLLNLLFFVALGCVTLRLLPFGQRLMFVILMFPMTLQQGMSYSYDVFVISFSLLITALFLRVNYDSTLTVRQQYIMISAMIVLTAILAPIKTFAYIMFALLPIYTVIHLFCGIKRDRIWEISKRSVLIIILAIVVVWIIIALMPGVFQEKPSYIKWADADGYSLSIIFHHPIKTIAVFIATFIQMGYYLFVDTLIGGTLGSLRIQLPDIFELIFLFLMILSILRSESTEIDLRKRTKWILIAVFVVTVLFVFLGIMVTWTPITSWVILGIQGRYFIPVIFMATILLNNNLIKVDDRIQKNIPLVAMATDFVIPCYIYMAAA